MAVIYLKHPVHGTKVAIAYEEAQADKAEGWQEYDPTAPQIKPVDVPAPSQPEPNAPTINALPARRGRGRPRAEPQGE